jgi:hypothetical protein
MSLKFFHVLFIGLSSLMALGVGLWAIDAWRTDGSAGWLGLAAVAFVGGAGLIVYGNRFIQKARKLGIAVILIAGSLGFPSDALACPACVGTTDSVLQSGMNMGIFALLGVTGFMLGCFATFFIYLARRAGADSKSHVEIERPAPGDFGVQEGSI